MCISKLILPSRLGLWNTATAPLQKGKTPSPNESPGYDTKHSDGDVPGVLGNAEHPFIAFAPRSTLAWNGSTWYAPIYGLNRTKLHIYAKLNCLNKNCLTKLNSLK